MFRLHIAKTEYFLHLATCRALTENTRASYPIENVANARVPCTGPHPKNIILLCCDAFGVLPPVSRLSPQQAMYHFISGYSAKVGATNVLL
jgi:phosphoenolpyruvate carboxykinase (ATP)